MAAKPSAVVSVLQALAAACSSGSITSPWRSHVELVLGEIQHLGVACDIKQCAKLSSRAAARIAKARGISAFEITDTGVSLNQSTEDEELREVVVDAVITQRLMDLNKRKEWVQQFLHRLQGVCAALVFLLAFRAALILASDGGEVLS